MTEPRNVRELLDDIHARIESTDHMLRFLLGLKARELRQIEHPTDEQAQTLAEIDRALTARGDRV